MPPITVNPPLEPILGLPDAVTLWPSTIPWPFYNVLAQQSPHKKYSALRRRGLSSLKVAQPKDDPFWVNDPSPTLPTAGDSPVAESSTERYSDLVTATRAQHCPQRKASVLPSASYLEVPLHHNQLAKSVVFLIFACVCEFTQSSTYTKK